MPDWFLIGSCGAVLLGAARIAATQLQGWQAQRRRRRRRAGAGHGAPLRRVVAACEARWFLDELKLAMDGDQEAMVRVGHMLLSGYGVKQDRAEAARWMRHAWAIQNYKEPAMIEMMDAEESAVPALNTQQQRQQEQWGNDSRQAEGPADAAASRQADQQRPRQRRAERQAAAEGGPGVQVEQRRRGIGEGGSGDGSSGGGGGSSSSAAVEPPSIQALYKTLRYGGPPAPSPEAARVGAAKARGEQLLYANEAPGMHVASTPPQQSFPRPHG